jgi:hypothetical protein
VDITQCQKPISCGRGKLVGVDDLDGPIVHPKKVRLADLSNESIAPKVLPHSKLSCVAGGPVELVRRPDGLQLEGTELRVAFMGAVDMPRIEHLLRSLDVASPKHDELPHVSARARDMMASVLFRGGSLHLPATRARPSACVCQCVGEPSKVRAAQHVLARMSEALQRRSAVMGRYESQWKGWIVRGSGEGCVQTGRKQCKSLGRSEGSSAQCDRVPSQRAQLHRVFDGCDNGLRAAGS